MRKLLRANLYRLRRSRALWLCAAASFAFSAFSLYRLSPDDEQITTFEMAILQIFPFFPLFYGTFSGLFLGVEYQDGTLFSPCARLLRSFSSHPLPESSALGEKI